MEGAFRAATASKFGAGGTGREVVAGAICGVEATTGRETGSGEFHIAAT
jgi:hypothetical protein